MTGEMRVLDPETLTDGADRAVHGVVLAAGTSSRYGHRNKLLETVAGEPLVGHAVRTLLAADLEGVTVVVGHEADRVRAALDGFDVKVRENEAFAAGQSTSLATGIEAARDAGADAALIALGDMPSVSVASVELIVEAYEAGAGEAVAAACDGKRGNPVLFDARYFETLLAVDGDTGGREILLTDPGAVAVETGDPGVLQDIDRPEDRPGGR